MGVCARAKRPPPGRGRKPESFLSSKGRLTQFSTQYDSCVASLPQVATSPRAFPGVREGRWAGAHTVSCGPRATVTHLQYGVVYLAADIVPAAHARTKPILHKQVRRQYRGSPFVTDVLPIPPFLSPPGPSVVTSPRAPRQSSSVLECFLRAVLRRPGRSFQNRPARTPPSPPPMSLPPFRLQASPIHAGLFFSSVRLLPCPHAASHSVFPHLTRLSLSSAPAQLSSGGAHTLTLSPARTRTSAAYSYCGRHGTAGQA